MTAALGAYDILGCITRRLPARLLRRDEVRKNRVHTRFIEAHLAELAAPPSAETLQAAAALGAFAASRDAEPLSAARPTTARGIVDTIGPVVW